MDLNEHKTKKKKYENENNTENLDLKVDMDIDTDSSKCDICGQRYSDITFYRGHPLNAVEEVTALTSEKLIFTSDKQDDIKKRPTTFITGFSIFDRHGHLVPIDGGLIKFNSEIYMSGYLTSISSDCPNIDEECIPTKEIGPLFSWYMHRPDEENKRWIVISSEFGEYKLLKPSDEYMSLMNNFYEKIWLSKAVVDFLQDCFYMEPSYEDLLQVVQRSTIPDLNNKVMSEEILLKHAQYVCDEISNLESDEADEACETLSTLPCVMELIKIANNKRKQNVENINNYKKVDNRALSKATTTPLVQKMFESLFTQHLDKSSREYVRKVRCGICEACQQPDCGECNNCRAMRKFGGTGHKKRTCIRRSCPKMAKQPAEDSTSDEGENDFVDDGYTRDTLPVNLEGFHSTIKWIGDPIKIDEKKTYYQKVKINGIDLCIGDFVMVATSRSNIPALVSKIVYMWKDNNDSKSGYFHAKVFMRSTDTVLGEAGNPREVFLADRCCDDTPLSSVLRKASVERKYTPENWFKLGGKEANLDFHDEDDGKTYFYSKYYERFTARFEELPLDPVCPNKLRKHRFCPSCERNTKKEFTSFPRVFDKLAKNSENVNEANRTEWGMVKWNDCEYKKGCGVFLRPGTFRLNNSLSLNQENPKIKRKKIPKKKIKKDTKVDEDIYPEYYRKSHNSSCDSNINTSAPFCVGYIVAVTAAQYGLLIPPQDIYLKVNILYRPENTTNRFPHHQDLNLVYWSDEICEVPMLSVVGLCQLSYIDNIPQNPSSSIYNWLEQDPNRMYFKLAYDKNSGKFKKVPVHAQSIGPNKDKYKGKGKGKGKSNNRDTGVNKFEEVNVRPLRTLDVFAGCGGLSEGLHQSGVAECKWAIENLEAAAHAYSLNNQKCIVFYEDCNALLKDAMSGVTHSAQGLRIPKQGEVELLCGGPPCQGFSGMNRFNSRDYSNFKNSLIASFLSYCDFYRPKYVVFENVQNFVAFKKGLVLKLTLRALLDIGFQCTFGILQAGSYGIPQTRRRLIILAAAPGFKLPLYPEPTHVFSRRPGLLNTTIDGKRFTSNIQWERSAPKRTCTIRDALSDLPDIASGVNNIEMEYDSMPESYFQRLVRNDQNKKLKDHICKTMAPLVQARICRIPKTPGSDWRDLPNIPVVLSDGTECNVLEYRYEHKKNGRSSKGALRGVCACAAGLACSPDDRQENTLIPWCLPHTADRHNNWAGLYGRLSWDGHFSTTVTVPEPMGKQGRVLHPEQDRVVSVRECARSQGFPDTYAFAGSVLDKYRQIGNAVPPPLAAAIGREIKKCLTSIEKNN